MSWCVSGIRLHRGSGGIRWDFWETIDFRGNKGVKEVGTGQRDTASPAVAPGIPAQGLFVV
jgi:hypothetical protein